MFRDLARERMGAKRARDSAIVQFVFAFEKASVAAAKTETSVEKVGEEDLSTGVGFCGREGIWLGSSGDVLEAGHSESCWGGSMSDLGGYRLGISLGF